jgi:propionyl-CoA carboxylase alpha chain
LLCFCRAGTSVQRGLNAEKRADFEVNVVMFNKILIANRGEIACRVMKTARRMGIKTVAIYSDADVDAVHVEMADEAVRVGPPPSAESYLNMPAILQAIEQTGADAVHPGYGFLSENAKFARALARKGIAFIGPKPRAITAMGDKIESKKLAQKAKVSTVPGHTEAVASTAEAVKIAKSIGYPVMLKASAGGGGKGMRIAHNDAEARDGFERATNEAKSSFGDDRVFIEKFITEPRHIEIQVLGDEHGNVVYLGERECSIQRRHQKVLEEAPSPFLDDATRKAMGEQAVQLAKAVKYVSAGTVEFIVDAERNFYFLEMNTRLQVEHPVTELVTGLDLVEMMIRVAAGEPLPFTQDDVRLDGWAIEARLYAEDPFRNFLPSIGRLVHFIPPQERNAGPGGGLGHGIGRTGKSVVRVDTGVEEGSEISMFYDPMIAKLITGGKDRGEALDGLSAALDAFYVRGVETNAAFLAALAAHPRVRSGAMTTNLIAEEYPDGFNSADLPDDEPGLVVAAAAAIHAAYQARAAKISGQTRGMERTVMTDWVVDVGGDQHAVRVTPADGGFDVTGEDGLWRVRTDWRLGEPLFRARINDRAVTFQVERDNVCYRLTRAGRRAAVHVYHPTVAELAKLMPVKEPPDLSKFLLSPMPGLLVSVAVAEGQEVKAGEELAVVEAMKMENVLRAERDGVVSAVKAAAGDSLMVDQVIVEFA